MGEYVWTQIVIGGKATRAVADELQTLLEETFPEGAEDVGGHMVATGERNYGNADEAEAFCQANALPYVLTWAAAGGCFDSGAHAWRPGMDGASDFTATEAGDASVTLAELRRDHEAGVTLAEIIARLAVADSDTLPPFEVEPGDATDAPHDAPDAAPAAPQTPDGAVKAEMLDALENAEAFLIDCPDSGRRDAALRDVRAAIVAAECQHAPPNEFDAIATPLRALLDDMGEEISADDLRHHPDLRRLVLACDDLSTARPNRLTPDATRARAGSPAFPFQPDMRGDGWRVNEDSRS